MNSSGIDRRLADSVAYRLSNCPYRELLRLARWCGIDKPTKMRRRELARRIVEISDPIGAANFYGELS